MRRGAGRRHAAGRDGNTGTGPANPVAATVDVLVVRPISFLGTVAGAGLWTITSPFTFINGTAAENYDLLVKTPGEYTFTRPLGEGV